MIGISADFDPVHNGHVKLIEKGREIASETGGQVIIYLNKDYSANHAPFFANYDVRREMALKAGADKVVPIEGLHHRLTLAYTVPIRIAMMIEDGVVDYVDAADVSTNKIQKYASSFAKKGIFSGIPRNLPNRNVIRWFAVNEFLYKKYKRKMKFHIIPELKMEGKISGREIRAKIIENNFKIPEEVKEVLPTSTVKILEKEIKKGNIPGKRDVETLTKRLNTYSRPKLLNIAHITADATDAIIEGRRYRNEDQIWASLRMAGYGPVLTRLAISSVEQDVTRKEVFELIKSYQADGIIPPDQTVESVIERAWFVASSVCEGIKSSDAHEMFRNGKRGKKPIYTIDAGMHLRSFEAEDLKDGIDALLYVDKNSKLRCQIRTETRKIKSPLKLPAKHATYLRLLIDSQFIPIRAQIVEKKEGIRVRIFIGE
ncbi:MAG: nucleotidyltransferase family protein [Methanobacterium sp.]|uniref:adenylyltransferase/cytidyltransferase family protein n=1 Tax=Methanobacterium sp. TaxID=2164 RepID=UPI003D65D1B6|nr:nucleotidyltransferase family protein [Methanobacterium sp.]